MSEPPTSVSKDLRSYGYAPGWYNCKCHTCEKEFVGDKRAITCEECARKRMSEAPVPSSNERLNACRNFIVALDAKDVPVSLTTAFYAGWDARERRLAVETTSDVKWRRLVAFGYGQHNLYLDDGEMQDNSRQPFIDFLRDSPDEIAAKIQQRGLSTLQSAEKASTDVVPFGFEMLYRCPSCQKPMKCGYLGWEYQCNCLSVNGTVKP